MARGVILHAMVRCKMELIYVFVAGLSLGLAICLFCDWRCQRLFFGKDQRPQASGTAGSPNPQQRETESDTEGPASAQVSGAEGGHPGNWQQNAAANTIADPRRDD